MLIRRTFARAIAAPARLRAVQALRKAHSFVISYMNFI
jgi:hypothetical protein